MNTITFLDENAVLPPFDDVETIIDSLSEQDDMNHLINDLPIDE